MAHDVFISYSAKDKTTADAVCVTLESEGVRCWIAPRDVTPGMEWSTCIIEAIKQARIMVLVFTANANASQQIRKEVERAVNHDLVILPFRVENVLPDESLEYFIGNVHWLDALTPPMEAHLKSLRETIKMLLARTPQPEAAGASQPSATSAASSLPQPPQPGPPAPGVYSTAPSWPSGPSYAAPNVPAPRESSSQKRLVTLLAWSAFGVLAVLPAAIFVAHRATGRSSAASASQAAPPLADGRAGGGSSAGPGLASENNQPPPAAVSPSSLRTPARTSLPASDAAADENKAETLISQKQYAEAKPLAQEACESGNASGCFNLGMLYDQGFGVPRDYAKAASNYQKACQGGVEVSCYNLGVFREHGLGVAQSFTQAAALYKQACDARYAPACSALGGLYRHGQGFVKDEGQAFLLFQQACNAGDAGGCGNVGLDYAYGLGVARDSAKGTEFLQKGCNGGDQWACDRLNRFPEAVDIIQRDN